MIDLLTQALAQLSIVNSYVIGQEARKALKEAISLVEQAKVMQESLEGNESEGCMDCRDCRCHDTIPAPNPFATRNP